MVIKSRLESGDQSWEACKMRDFGRRLHKALSERGIKQVELARAVGVPPTTISGWFRGAHEPDFEKLLKIWIFQWVSLSESKENPPLSRG